MKDAKIFERRGTEVPNGQEYATYPEVKKAFAKHPEALERLNEYHLRMFGRPLLFSIFHQKELISNFSPWRAREKLDRRVLRRRVGLDPFAGLSDFDPLASSKGPKKI